MNRSGSKDASYVLRRCKTSDPNQILTCRRTIFMGKKPEPKCTEGFYVCVCVCVLCVVIMTPQTFAHFPPNSPTQRAERCSLKREKVTLPTGMSHRAPTRVYYQERLFSGTWRALLIVGYSSSNFSRKEERAPESIPWLFSMPRC